MSWEAWGTPEYLDYPECETCDGTGTVEGESDGTHGNRHQEACPDCNGTGCQEPPERMEDGVI